MEREKQRAGRTGNGGEVEEREEGEAGRKEDGMGGLYTSKLNL